MGDKKLPTYKGRDDMTPLISKLLMFKTMMDNSVDSIYFKDKDFRFIFVNKNKAIRHGIKNPAEMNGKTDFDFFSESDAKEIFEVEKSIFETGHPNIGKIEKLTRHDGNTTWISSSKYPLYDKNGKIVGIWGISRDITEYEMIREALRSSQRKLADLIDFLPDATLAIDKEKRVIIWNKAIEKMQRHSEIGYRILSSVNEFSTIADDVLEHHERWDGKGYPRGLKGEEISKHARIIALADSYETMTSDRTYSKVLSKDEAVDEVKQCSGTQFDPDIAKLFVEKILGKEW